METPLTTTTPAASYAISTDEARWQAGGVGFEMKMLARGADTGGTITVMDYTCPAGFGGPPVHAHDDVDELMFVVEGALVVEIDAARRMLEAGGFAYIPKGSTHGFANHSDAPCRFVDIYNPAGPEELFVAIDDHVASSADGPDPAVLLELNKRYCRVVGPPIGRAE